MKVSVVIPVYYNELNLQPLYEDLKKQFIDKIDFEYEIVMVNDGSKDSSYEIMKKIALLDNNVKIISLSRNFGSFSAVLCGLSKCSGDCAVVKAADLQEPTSLLMEMIEKWKSGFNVVLAVRESRDDSKIQSFFSDLYYKVMKKIALSEMPEHGFDCFLVDRKVISVLDGLDEKNSSLTGQILWSGFKTDIVYYHRLRREIGTSKWTLKKKIRLFMDSIFSFTTLPITIVFYLGMISVFIAIVWGIDILVCKFLGKIPVSGWTALIIFNLFSFGIIMVTLGILGEYLWRTFDASRHRPLYIIEEDNFEDKDKIQEK